MVLHLLMFSHPFQLKTSQNFLFQSILIDISTQSQFLCFSLKALNAEQHSGVQLAHVAKSAQGQDTFVEESLRRRERALRAKKSPNPSFPPFHGTSIDHLRVVLCPRMLKNIRETYFSFNSYISQSTLLV